jgi:hypothetical protein
VSAAPTGLIDDVEVQTELAPDPGQAQGRDEADQ